MIACNTIYDYLIEKDSLHLVLLEHSSRSSVNASCTICNVYFNFIIFLKCLCCQTSFRQFLKNKKQHSFTKIAAVVQKREMNIKKDAHRN